MPKDTTMTISAGGQSVTMTEDEFFAAAKRMGEADRKRRKAPPVKNTPEDQKVTDQAYSVAADELRSFIERAEQMAAEKKDAAEREKEIFAEAKARGYSVKVMKKVIAMRKRDRDDLAEEEAITAMYLAAMGMG